MEVGSGLDVALFKAYQNIKALCVSTTKMLHKLIHLEKIQYYSANITYSFHTVAVEEYNFNVLLKTVSCYGT